MAQNFTLQAVNGLLQPLAVTGAPGGSQLIVLSFATPPSAGTVTIQTRAIGETTYRALAKVTAASVVSGLLLARVDGPISGLSVQFSGLTGSPAGASLWIAPQSFPIGAYTGLAAMTTQPYTEANVKNGLQFYGRATWPASDPIAAGTSRKLWFQTGAKGIIVKSREIHYVAEELSVSLFANPTGVTGGTALTVHNFNTVVPQATTVQGKKDVTTVSDGVEIDGGDNERLYGSQASGSRAAASIPQGRERILPPNSEFLVVITNTGTGDARVQYFLDWYEGDTDLPL